MEALQKVVDAAEHGNGWALLGLFLGLALIGAGLGVLIYLGYFKLKLRRSPMRAEIERLLDDLAVRQDICNTARRTQREMFNVQKDAITGLVYGRSGRFDNPFN